MNEGRYEIILNDKPLEECRKPLRIPERLAAFEKVAAVVRDFGPITEYNVHRHLPNTLSADITASIKLLEATGCVVESFDRLTWVEGGAV